MTPLWLALAGAAVAVLGVGACSTAEGPAQGNDPYASFPPCEPAPAPAANVDPVKGLVLPDGASVQSSSVSGPLTTVNAYVAATPIDVREELSRRDGVEVLHAEDEVFEAELLLSTEGRRSLVTAVAVCDAASRIVAVVSADGGAGLPSPGAQR